MGIRKHIPNTITSMNLLCGTVGVILTLHGAPDTAFYLMLGACVADFADGLSARLLGAYSDIGKELDSLSDMVSFGVLPALMLWASMDKVGAWVGVTRWITLILAVCSALRLAKFNVDERQHSDFLGVATPTSALIVGSLVYLMYHSEWKDSMAQSWWALPLVAVVLSLLVVSEIPCFGMKIQKGGGIRALLASRRRRLFFEGVIICCAMTWICGMNWSLAVLSSFTLYIIINVTAYLAGAKTKEKGPEV